MRINEINIENLNEKYLDENKFNNGILYYIDRLEVINNLKNINLNKLIEFRIFNIKSEIKGININGTFKVVLKEDEEKDKILEEKYILDREDFNEILVKKYLDIDEDGQYYIYDIRPAAIG